MAVNFGLSLTKWRNIGCHPSRYITSASNRLSILFRFAQPNRKHFCYKLRRQIIKQIVEEAASNNRVYLQESETTGKYQTLF